MGYEGANLSHWEVLKKFFLKMLAFYLNIKVYTSKRIFVDSCFFLKELLSLGLGWASVGGLMFNI